MIAAASQSECFSKNGKMADGRAGAGAAGSGELAGFVFFFDIDGDHFGITSRVARSRARSCPRFRAASGTCTRAGDLDSDTVTRIARCVPALDESRSSQLQDEAGERW